MLGHTIAKIRQPRTWASRLDFVSTRSSLKGRSFPKTARWNNCHKRISEWCQGVCETAHDVCQGIRETAHDAKASVTLYDAYARKLKTVRRP